MKYLTLFFYAQLIVVSVLGLCGYNVLDSQIAWAFCIVLSIGGIVDTMLMDSLNKLIDKEVK